MAIIIPVKAASFSLPVHNGVKLAVTPGPVHPVWPQQTGRCHVGTDGRSGWYFSVCGLIFTTWAPQDGHEIKCICPSPPPSLLVLLHWWPICYWDVDVRKLCIAFQLLRFSIEMIDWSFIFDFLLYMPFFFFFLSSIYAEYWGGGGGGEWLAEVKETVCFRWFFFFLLYFTQDLRWIKVYANCFTTGLCWEVCVSG